MLLLLLALICVKKGYMRQLFTHNQAICNRKKLAKLTRTHPAYFVRVALRDHYFQKWVLTGSSPAPAECLRAQTPSAKCGVRFWMRVVCFSAVMLCHVRWSVALTLHHPWRPTQDVFAHSCHTVQGVATNKFNQYVYGVNKCESYTFVSWPSPPEAENVYVDTTSPSEVVEQDISLMSEFQAIPPSQSSRVAESQGKMR